MAKAIGGFGSYPWPTMETIRKHWLSLSTLRGSAITAAELKFLLDMVDKLKEDLDIALDKVRVLQED